MDPLIIVFGLGVGILVGMTGIGGGSLMTPILILVFGFKPITAIGTDLAYGAVTKTVGGWRHFRQRTVNSSLSTWMAIGSVPAAVGGVYVLRALERAAGHSFDDLLLTVLAGALLFTGAAVLARALLLRSIADREREQLDMTTRDKVAAVVLGVLVGFVLGVTSAGSGSLIAVGLILLFKLAPRQVVGTDIFHAAILLWAAAIAHVVAGNVDFALAGTILIGSIPGVWLGSHWSSLVPIATLRHVLGIVLIGGGLGLLSKAGAGIPPAIIAGVPVVIALVAGGPPLRRRLRRRREATAHLRVANPVAAPER
jgi:uncharacterized membrane protein YfcA